MLQRTVYLEEALAMLLRTRQLINPLQSQSHSFLLIHRHQLYKNKIVQFSNNSLLWLWIRTLHLLLLLLKPNPWVEHLEEAVDHYSANLQVKVKEHQLLDSEGHSQARLKNQLVIFLVVILEPPQVYLEEVELVVPLKISLFVLALVNKTNNNNNSNNNKWCLSLAKI